MALLAAVIHLKPSRPLPAWSGRAAQAWFLDNVRRADPALARVLHGDPHDARGQERRPYTISVSQDQPGQTWLRITSFSPVLTAFLEGTFLPSLHDPITLTGIDIEIAGIATSGHPWAGRSDYEQIARQAFDLSANADHLRPAFQFATPTAFRHNGLLIPLPLPEMVYGSLIRAWDSFSPVGLPVRLNDFLAQAVAIARHRLMTHTVRLGKDEQYVGFTGSVEYALLAENSGLSEDAFRQRVQTLALLTDFAFYTGVGIRTAVGMGQLRPD